MSRIDAAGIGTLHTLAGHKIPGTQIRAAFLVGLTTNYGNHHEILVVISRSYPLKAPAVYVLTAIPGQYRIEHIWGDDGRCCLFEKYGRDWDTKECDLVTVVTWSAAWLFCQEFFQRNGYWPAPESHQAKPRRRSQPWDARKRR